MSLCPKTSIAEDLADIRGSWFSAAENDNGGLDWWVFAPDRETGALREVAHGVVGNDDDFEQAVEDAKQAAIAALKAYGYEPEPPRPRLTEEEAAALLDDAPVLDDESEPEPDLELGDPAAVQYGG